MNTSRVMSFGMHERYENEVRDPDARLLVSAAHAGRLAAEHGLEYMTADDTTADAEMSDVLAGDEGADEFVAADDLPDIPAQERARETEPDAPPTAGGGGRKPPTDTPAQASDAPFEDEGPEPTDEPPKMRWERGAPREALAIAVGIVEEDSDLDLNRILDNSPTVRRLLPDLLNTTKTIKQISDESGLPASRVSGIITQAIERLRAELPLDRQDDIPRPSIPVVPTAPAATTDIGAQLNVQRHEQDISIPQLAARVGVAPSTLYRLFDGDTTVTSGIVSNVMSELGIPPNEAAERLAAYEATSRPPRALPGPRGPRPSASEILPQSAVGVQLNELRRQQNLTIPQLASRLGVAPSTLSRLFAGKTTASSEVVGRVAEGLGLSPVERVERMARYEADKGAPKSTHPSRERAIPEPAEEPADAESHKRTRKPSRYFPDDDLREVMTAAQTGDSTAQARLFAVTTGLMRPLIATMAWEGMDQEEVQADVLARLARISFDPHLPVEAGTDPADLPAIVEARYRQYIRLTVRSAVIDRAAVERMELTLGPTELAQAYHTAEQAGVATRSITYLEQLPKGTYATGDATRGLPAERLAEVLSAGQREAVSLRAAGLSYADIATQKGITAVEARRIVRYAHSAIEREILEPRGIKPLRTFPEGARLESAARQGQIPSVSILGTYYTSEAWLPQLQSAASDERLHVLSQLATDSEIQAFQRTYPNEVIVAAKRAYIREEALPHLQEIMRLKRANRTPPAPHPDYTSVPAIARNRSEASVLRNHLRAGGFEDVLRQGHYRYVRTADAEQFLEEYRRRQGQQ